MLPGILAIVAIDEPSYVSEYLDLPGEIADARAAMGLARHNLSQLAPPAYQVLRAADADPTSELHLFTTEDFFGVSRLLVLDQRLAQLGVSMGPRRCPRLRTQPAPARRASHHRSLRRRRDQPDGQHRAPRVPDPGRSDLALVYHVAADGRSMQVNHLTDDGTMTIEVRDGLADAFAAVGLTTAS